MPLPKKPEFARIYSPVAGLLVLFCILIIARYARLGYGGVSRIFRCYLPLVRLLFDAWRSRIEFRVTRLIFPLFLQVAYFTYYHFVKLYPRRFAVSIAPRSATARRDNVRVPCFLPVRVDRTIESLESRGGTSND